MLKLNCFQNLSKLYSDFIPFEQSVMNVAHSENTMFIIKTTIKAWKKIWDWNKYMVINMILSTKGYYTVGLYTEIKYTVL